MRLLPLAFLDRGQYVSHNYQYGADVAREQRISITGEATHVLVHHGKLQGRDVLNTVSHNVPLPVPFLFPSAELKVCQGRINLEIRLFLTEPVFVDLE